MDEWRHVEIIVITAGLRLRLAGARRHRRLPPLVVARVGHARAGAAERPLAGRARRAVRLLRRQGTRTGPAVGLRLRRLTHGPGAREERSEPSLPAVVIEARRDQRDGDF